MKVALIVEGDGEVAAAPVLLRRLSQWRIPPQMPEILTPIRIRRNRFLNKTEDFHKYIRLATAKAGSDGWVLILLDADDDCPATKGAEILQRVQACVGESRVSVVLANREYEAWFIAAATSLNGRRDFVLEAQIPANPEVPRNAKGWIGSKIQGRGYSEITDQPAFSAVMDLQLAFDGCRSFRKLCSEWDKQVVVAATGQSGTPTL